MAERHLLVVLRERVSFRCWEKRMEIWRDSGIRRIPSRFVNSSLRLSWKVCANACTDIPAPKSTQAPVMSCFYSPIREFNKVGDFYQHEHILKKFKFNVHVDSCNILRTIELSFVEFWNLRINSQNLKILISHILDFKNKEHTKFQFNWSITYRNINEAQKICDNGVRFIT